MTWLFKTHAQRVEDVICTITDLQDDMQREKELLSHRVSEIQLSQEALVTRLQSMGTRS